MALRRSRHARLVSRPCQSTGLRGQLSAAAFQTYTAANAASIAAGPFALYTVAVGGIRPTQLNEGFVEVGKKTAGFDLLSPAGLQSNLLASIEPVVIGPGGVLYLTDGHHTFTALDKSIYGASNPTVYVNVVANYSNLTNAQFFQTMQSQNLLLPLDNGVAKTVNPATGAPIPTTLTGLTNDPYRGLEYSILKNKSATLFPTAANITGAAGPATPGLDKMTGFYADFLEAAAYRNANNGRGLPYLSTGDIALSTQWNLNGASASSLPNIGPITAAQLPGFILANSLTLNAPISNATLANGALDGNGTFTGVTSVNFGTAATPIRIGTPNTGFVLQLGSDRNGTVTLGGANTYTGGTSILAGNLIVASDAALGAAVPAGATIDPANVRASVQAANGIVFNSLSEGAGTLTLGTTPGNGTATFTTARPIAISGEVATLNINGYQTTLMGPLASFGSNGVGLGNATGVSDLTIDDNSANKGVLTLSTASPYFYGNIIVGGTNAPTVRVMNDAALGNTTGTAATIGQVNLNSGTLQAGASFTANERNLFLGSGSNFDVNGFTTSWGNLTNVQRTLVILNSNTATAGAVTFNSLDVGATATVQLAGGTAGETVTLTNGITREAGATLVIQPTSATSLGTNTEKLFSGTGAASLVNGIAPAYIVTNGGTKNSGGPYDFVTYGANGYVKATYSQNTLTNTPTSTVALAANAAPVGNVAAFALNTQGKTVTLGATNTLTLGGGTNPAGLILATGSAISNGTLAFGGSEGVIWLSGTNSTISSTITGNNGLTFAGSGAVALHTAAAVSGAITIDSGTVTLAGANIFATDVAGITLSNVKSKPAAATLAVTAANSLTTLNSVGTNSAATLSNGATLTIGDTTNNLSSTLSSAITQTGAATAGALTFNGSGLMDLSGGKSITLATGSTIVVNNSAQLRLAAGEIKSNFGIVLNGTSDLQFAQNGGGQFANAVSGTGTLHLIGGTLQITGTGNTYSGGTIVETGSVLDITTANLPAANPNITNAGGLVLFDQATNGTYAGVISDGRQLGTGALFSGSFDKDDSTGANAGNVTLAKAQAYTGATTVEAGTLTLGAVDTLATSSGVDLGRVGGGATATLALAANNTVQALTSEAGNNTAVTLGANTLTINTAATTIAGFGGTISGAGNLVKTGAGIEILAGANTYTGTTSVNGGTLLAGAANTFSAASATSVATGGTLDLGGTAQTINTVALAGGTLRNGALTGAVTSTGGIIDTLGGPASVTTNAGITTAIGTNSYTGATNVNGGTLLAGAANTFSAASATSVATGGTLDLGGTAQTVNTIALAGGTLRNGALTGAVTSTGGTIDTLGGGASVTTSAGTTIAVGTNTYTGGTTINGGTLQIGNGGTTGSISGNVVDNGTLAFNRADTSIYANVISGTGRVQQTGTGTTILTATNTYTGGTTIAAGTLQLGNGGTTGSIVGNVVDNSNLAFNRSNTATFAGIISGTGNVQQNGTGTTILTAANTYTGATTINAGTLEVDGSIASPNVTVNNGGTLSGTGKIGDPQINAGGTLSPGNAANPTGTLTIVGPLGFAAGSFYNVAITPTANSRTNVVGATTIAGGTVRVAAGQGTYQVNTRYTILTSSAGVTGRFTTAVATNLAFLAPTLAYDANDVYLTLTQARAFRTAAATQNQASVASGLDASVRNVTPNTSGSRLVGALDQLTVPQARAAFDGLSGEGITAAQNIAHRSAELFTSSIFDQTTFYGAAANAITLTEPVRELADLPSKAVQPVFVAPTRTWRAWATGFGGVEDIHGNAALGTAYQQNTIYGGVLGVDYQVTPNYLFGVALGGSSGDFLVPARATSGSTTGGHVAIYDLATFGSFYGASSSSFSYYTNRSNRTVYGFGGLGNESERGSFDSHEFRTRLEFGRHLDGVFGLGGVTPFIALELADLRSNGFTESTTSGAGLYRLNVSGQSAASVPAFVGARFQHVTPLGGGMVLTPTLQVAYVHEFAPYRSQIGTIADLPGSTFLVDGARPSRDAAQVKAGAQIAIGAHSTIFANFDGELSGVNQLYAGKGGFRYDW